MITNLRLFIPLLTFIFLFLGFIIGSFLNVVSYRINTKKSLGGRSACMSCQHKLRWYELIPVFSFLFLKGRCLCCKTKISIQYPLVECITGVIFSLLFLKFQAIFFSSILTFVVVYLYYAVMFSLLMIIVVYDLRHKIIPNSLSLLFGILAFIGLFFLHLNYFGNYLNESIFYFSIPSLIQFISGILVALPFYLLWLVSRGTWMGLGDAKLALGIGYFLGLPLSLSAIVLAFWVGAIVGLCLIIISKIYKRHGNFGMKSEIPFAPYLVFGIFIAFFFNFYIFPL